MSTVNHPEHYNEHPSGVECIDIVGGFNFNVGNAIKYLWRAGLKSDNPIEDLEKAAWYCNREIERLIEEAARTAVQPKQYTYPEAKERFFGGDGLEDLIAEGQTSTPEFHIQFHTRYEPQSPTHPRISMAGWADHLTLDGRL